MKRSTTSTPSATRLISTGLLLLASIGLHAAPAYAQDYGGPGAMMQELIDLNDAGASTSSPDQTRGGKRQSEQASVQRHGKIQTASKATSR